MALGKSLGQRASGASGTAEAVTDPFTVFESRQLRHLLAVVECKGFTRAAEKLNLTQPALTRSIQLLEERLGARLIERTPKSFSLTRFGQIVVARAQFIEIEFYQTISEINALKTGYSGSLSIGVGPSSISYLAPAISAFQKQRPNVKVKIIVESMQENLRALMDGELDVICTALQFPKHNKLAVEKLAEIRNVIVADECHPLTRQVRVEPEALLHYPWAVFANDQMGYERIGAYFAANDLDPPEPAIETNNIGTIFSLLKEGNYLASAPSILLPEARKAGLDEIKISGSFWSISFGVAYIKSVQPPPAVTSLISALRSRFKNAAL